MVDFAVNVCINRWMSGNIKYCKVLWIKALYKCSQYIVLRLKKYQSEQENTLREQRQYLCMQRRRLCAVLHYVCPQWTDSSSQALLLLLRSENYSRLSSVICRQKGGRPALASVSQHDRLFALNESKTKSWYRYRRGDDGGRDVTHGAPLATLIYLL